VRTVSVCAAVAALALAGGAAAADYKPDGEGFIRHWLILAPIPLDAGQSGADGLKKEQVTKEAALKPKAGDKVKVGTKELEWKRYEGSDFLVNFNAHLGGENVEDSVGYAVTYVVTDREVPGVRMKMGSDDQAKVYLNGKEVLANEEARPTEKDQNTSDKLTLTRGVNVLVFKVVNEKVDWSGCIRFVDADDKPVTGYAVRLEP
jgi:opacity protein-like surface antigen